MAKKERAKTEVNAGSMADIAFLLLIFFLVTTQIKSDKGIQVRLPPKKEDQQDVEIKERNVFNILINRNNDLLVEREFAEMSDLSPKVKEFVMNNGRDPDLSESPEKAVVSLKTDRGTDYETYITVYDQIKKTYNEIRAAHLEMTLEAYEALDPKDPADKEQLDEAAKAYPFQVSDAEPSNAGG